MNYSDEIKKLEAQISEMDFAAHRTRRMSIAELERHGKAVILLNRLKIKSGARKCLGQRTFEQAHRISGIPFKRWQKMVSDCIDEGLPVSDEVRKEAETKTNQ